jgi:hypothetical protein
MSGDLLKERRDFDTLGRKLSSVYDSKADRIRRQGEGLPPGISAKVESTTVVVDSPGTLLDLPLDFVLASFHF